MDEPIKLGLALSDRLLALEQQCKLLLDVVRFQNVFARGAIDLRAEGLDAIFICVLHGDLASHGAAEEVVAIDQVCRRPDVSREQNADQAQSRAGDPGSDFVDARLPATRDRHARGKGRRVRLLSLARMDHVAIYIRRICSPAIMIC